jgi:hypothetical protein
MTEAFLADSTTKTNRSNPSVHRALPASVQHSQGRHVRVAAERDHAAVQPARPHENAARASILSILHFSRMTPAPIELAKFDRIKSTASAGISPTEIPAFHPLRRSREILSQRLHFLYFTLPA